MKKINDPFCYFKDALKLFKNYKEKTFSPKLFNELSEDSKILDKALNSIKSFASQELELRKAFIFPKYSREKYKKNINVPKIKDDMRAVYTFRFSESLSTQKNKTLDTNLDKELENRFNDFWDFLLNKLCKDYKANLSYLAHVLVRAILSHVELYGSHSLISQTLENMKIGVDTLLRGVNKAFVFSYKSFVLKTNLDFGFSDRDKLYLGNLNKLVEFNKIIWELRTETDKKVKSPSSKGRQRKTLLHSCAFKIFVDHIIEQNKQWPQRLSKNSAFGQVAPLFASLEISDQSNPIRFYNQAKGSYMLVDMDNPYLK